MILFYRHLFQHATEATQLTKSIEIKEGQLTQFDMNTGIQLIPTDPKMEAPYKWVIEDLTTSEVVLEAGQTWGPLPIAPGKYRFKLRQTQHAHELVEMISEFEIQNGTLAELEV